MLLTQQNKILALLQSAGTSGVSSYDLTYKHDCKQAPTRISELKAKGHLIVSKRHGRSVIYILLQGSQVTTSPPAKPTLGSFNQQGEYGAPYQKDGRTYWRYFDSQKELEAFLEPQQKLI